MGHGAAGLGLETAIDLLPDLHCTAGCHPTSTAEMDAHATGPPGYMAELRALIEQDRAGGGSKRIISVGEIGLGTLHLCHSM